MLKAREELVILIVRSDPELQHVIRLAFRHDPVLLIYAR
jgi:hypothetical protein